MSCTPSLWRRSPLADTPSLLANGGDILKCWDVLKENRLSGFVLYEETGLYFEINFYIKIPFLPSPRLVKILIVVVLFIGPDS